MVSRTVRMAQNCGTEQPDSAKTLADVSETMLSYK